MKMLFAMVLTLSAAGAFAQPDMAKYDKSCKLCHSASATGEAKAPGAPKTGDAAAWAPRIAKGMAVLLVSVRKGLRQMPPKAMCFDCTDEDYTALITYMSTPTQ